MKNQHKLTTSALFVAFAMLTGCDTEHPLDDGNDASLDSSEAPRQGAVPNEAADEDDVSSDEFEISLDEALDESPDNFTSLPRPAAGFCDGYNGGNYCYAKCGDGKWHMVGHASAIPYGSCTSEGDKRCGGYWNHFGSCWGNG